MVETDAAQKMSRLRDEDLLRIANTDREEDYLPGMVAAARSEVERRGLSEEDRSRIVSDVAVEQAMERSRSTAPLSNRGWLVFLLFGWALIITIPAIILLGAQGYRQKARDAIGATIWSYILWFVLSGVLIGGIALVEYLTS